MSKSLEVRGGPAAPHMRIGGGAWSSSLQRVTGWPGFRASVNAAEPRPCPRRHVPVRTCRSGRSGRRGAGFARVRRAGTGDITRYAAHDAAHGTVRFIQRGVTTESPGAGVP